MILYGAGGHGKVVSTLCSDNLSFFFDQDFKDDKVNGFKVIGYSSDINSEESVVVSIGDNKIRRKVVRSVLHDFTKVTHMSSLINEHCEIGEGTQIMHGAIVQIGSQIGPHVIINTSASIDHDCKIGDFVHIAPNCTLCGNVEIGEGTMIGAGTTIIPGIRIGKWSIIGAGSVVVNNIPDNVIVFGNPAKIIREIE